MKTKNQNPPGRVSPAQCLRTISRTQPLAQRMHQLARMFLGTPYAAHSLIGGPETKEQLVTGLGRFDCVTFVESVLALARSERVGQYERELVRLRYRAGQVSHRKRLHYFSDWLSCNHQRGLIRVRTRGVGAQTFSVSLSVLPEFSPRARKLSLVPKKNIQQAWRRISNGSIVAFGSTRAGLDFFHTGLLFGHRAQDGVGQFKLFHASQSQGRVVAEPLADFLKRNRMRGLALAAPLAPGDEA